MTMHTTHFQRAYTIGRKGYGGERNVRGAATTTVVEMGPEDFHLLDTKKALARYASPANQGYIDRRVRGDRDPRYWGSVKDNAALAALLREGWAEGAEKIMDLAAELRPLIPSPMGPRRRLRWSDQGDSLEMGRVYSGQLDRAWRSMPRQRDRAPRVISIDADVGQNAGVDAEDLFWAGAAAVALTDALEDAGYRVELFSTSASYLPGGGVALTRLVAKRAQEPLNPVLAAALVSHPATFRWYHLMSWLRHPQEVGWGFGSCSAVQGVLEAAVLEGVLEGAELAISESLSRNEAIKECTAAIERLTQEQDVAEGSMS
jgi:hypothetical protein